MSALWTADQVRRATGGELVGAPWTVEGIAIDTRDLQPGELFVALAGDHRDGHLFIGAAVDGGAGAVMAARGASLPPDGSGIVVRDTLQGLSDLGRHRRAASSARIVGITGSAGKTTAKAALGSLLGLAGLTHASAKSHNNHWGVPLSLSRMPLDAAFGVFELGMNHAGEIRALAAQVRPHVALITTIAPAHLGNFRSVEEIARAKAELFEHIEPGGTIALPADNPWFDLLRALAKRSPAGRILSFGRASGADVHLVAERCDARGSQVLAAVAGDEISFYLPLPGSHQVDNSLGWLAVIHALGLDQEKAAAAMGLLRPLNGRGLLRPVALPGGGKVVLLDESYNANPASMAAALDVLSRQSGRKVAVLGDMLELGPRSDVLHQELAPTIEAAGVDAAFLCGGAMAGLAGRLACPIEVHHASSSIDLLPVLTNSLQDGDVVLVKGSLGSRMQVIVDGLDELGGGAF